MMKQTRHKTRRYGRNPSGNKDSGLAVPDLTFQEACRTTLWF